MLDEAKQSDTVGFWFWMAVTGFNVSGLINCLIANEIDIKGAGGALTGFQPSIQFISQTTVSGLVLLCRQTKFTMKYIWLPYKYWYILGLELFGNVFYWLGIGAVGSGLSVVLYSSVVVFTGIFSKLLFNKSISWVRWCSIICIWTSIGLSAIGRVGAIESFNQIIGIFAGILAAVFLGASWVLIEHHLLVQISPLETAFIMWPLGLIGITWMTVVDGLLWRKIITNPIQSADPNYSIIIIVLLFAIFFASNTMHQVSFFFTMNGGRAAAVGAAVSKSLQAVLVFVSSDLYFCPTYSWNAHRSDTQMEQCITSWKLVGLTGTVIGVLIYSFDGLLWRRSEQKPVSPLYKRLIDTEVDASTSLINNKPTYK